jgi:DNA repair exonuclease SbcCD nuclease subunit
MFKKIALYTDIHFGAKSNSVIHNQDCLDYVDWFCQHVKDEPGIDTIIFMGDYFENRSSINIQTLEYAYQGAKKINELGLPVIHIVGNHDLHKRNTRDIHSVNIFNEFNNFEVVDKITVMDKFLFSPFLFDDEYKDLYEQSLKQKSSSIFGHLEFKNFCISGYNTVMESGPSHEIFKQQDHVFAGHFHKRQASDNVIYIGNTFPTNFGDAGDYERGMCFYDVDENVVSFENWEDCPKYYRTTLSAVIGEQWKPDSKMKVRCLVDVDISYSEAQAVKEAMIEMYELREFSLEENRSLKQDLLEGEDNDGVDFNDLHSIDELVVKNLETMQDTNVINPAKLIEIYKQLPTDL